MAAQLNHRVLVGSTHRGDEGKGMQKATCRYLLVAMIAAALVIAFWVWNRRFSPPEEASTKAVRIQAPHPQTRVVDAEPATPADLVGGATAGKGPGRAHHSITRSYQPISGDAAQVFATLEAQARTGDNEAALQLYIKVNHCRLATANAITRAPQTDPRALIPLDCRSLTPEHYREAARWLERAADGGHVYAQFMYVDSIEGVLGPRSEWLRDPSALERYKRKSMGFLHANAARGSIEALHTLARTYAVGVRTPKDEVRAYAYYHATKLADPGPATTWRRMDEVGQRLSPQQLSQATQQGRRIYEQCCTH
ncbi:MAG: sel1 repeat family protein [Lysobacter sp.]|nr:sel1 repeat family protein [Lysobacter sp.]